MKVRPLRMAFLLIFLTSPALFAEQVSLQDVPPLPQDTPLFKGEIEFGQRGRIGGFVMKPCRYGIYYDKKVHREDSAQSIFMRYRKSPGVVFCGTYLVVVGDLSKYATITFWIKGEKGGETFEIGMNDTISNKREDAVFVGSVYRYLPNGVTTQWQEVKIPLEDFFGVDMSRIYTLVFNFNEEGEGSFWIDGLRFHQEVLVQREDEIIQKGELLLDNFDHSDLNLLGRKSNAYKRLPSVCTFSRVSNSGRGHHGRSLRLDFDKKTTGWCGYYTLLNQIDGDYFDLSAYKSVSFWTRGEKGGETFEIGMADKSWLTIGDSVKAGPIEKYLPKGLSTQWQEVVIPLTDFGKLDWTQMGSFVINFYRPSKGTVYCDDVRFIRKSQDDLLKEWGN